MLSLRSVTAVTTVAALIAVVGCGRTFGSPPRANLVVSAGDSTYWVTTGGERTLVRSAPFLLAPVEGRFYEIFIADQDRSFYDAVIVGQQIYKRDIVSGDSTLLLDDELTRDAAIQYATEHPGEAPLSDDEEENPAANTVAFTETEIVEVLGPYLTYEQQVDFDGSWLRGTHAVRRGVIDLRSGAPVTLDALVGPGVARQVQLRGVSLLGSANDSVRSARDARAARAREAMTGFALDSASFSLVVSAGAPAVAFFVPGRGVRAAGYALPLEPIDIPAGPWWQEVRETLPTAVPGGDDLWKGQTEDVVARYDVGTEHAELFLRLPGGSREWRVAGVQAPVRRIARIGGVRDDETTAALRRAFDEALLYSGEARTASTVRRRPPVNARTRS